MVIGTFQALAVVVLALLPGSLYTYAFERQAGRWGASGTDRLLRFLTASALVHALLGAATYQAYRTLVPTGRLARGDALPWWVWLVVLGYVAPGAARRPGRDRHAARPAVGTAVHRAGTRPAGLGPPVRTRGPDRLGPTAPAGPRDARGARAAGSRQLPRQVARRHVRRTPGRRRSRWLCRRISRRAGPLPGRHGGVRRRQRRLPARRRGPTGAARHRSTRPLEPGRVP